MYYALCISKKLNYPYDNPPIQSEAKGTL